MRRALLTARTKPPVTVGNSSDSSTGYLNTYAAWSTYAPASGAGSLSVVRINTVVAVTVDYAFFTISPARVVTAISATITTDLSAGTVNEITLPAPLAVNAGDYIGIWYNGATGQIGRATAFGFNIHASAGAIAKPTPGATLAIDASTFDSHLLISATS